LVLVSIEEYSMLSDMTGGASASDSAVESEPGNEETQGDAKPKRA
jgi:hypothetical protein